VHGPSTQPSTDANFQSAPHDFDTMRPHRASMNTKSIKEFTVHPSAYLDAEAMMETETASMLHWSAKKVNSACT